MSLIYRTVYIRFSCDDCRSAEVSLNLNDRSLWKMIYRSWCAFFFRYECSVQGQKCSVFVQRFFKMRNRAHVTHGLSPESWNAVSLQPGEWASTSEPAEWKSVCSSVRWCVLLVIVESGHVMTCPLSGGGKRPGGWNSDDDDEDDDAATSSPHVFPTSLAHRSPSRSLALLGHVT